MLTGFFRSTCNTLTLPPIALSFAQFFPSPLSLSLSVCLSLSLSPSLSLFQHTHIHNTHAHTSLCVHNLLLTFLSSYKHTHIHYSVSLLVPVSIIQTNSEKYLSVALSLSSLPVRSQRDVLRMRVKLEANER